MKFTYEDLSDFFMTKGVLVNDAIVAMVICTEAALETEKEYFPKTREAYVEFMNVFIGELSNRKSNYHHFSEIADKLQ